MKYRVAALLLVVSMMLISACGHQENSGYVVAESSSSATASEKVEAANAEPEETALDPVMLEQLMKLASIYDRQGGGGTLMRGTPVHYADSTAFAYLYQNDLLAPYENSILDGWTVPSEVLAEVNGLLFESIETPDEGQLNGGHSYAGRWDSRPFELVLEESVLHEDGSVSVTYRREKNDAVLMPVTYTFAPFTVQEIPDVLSGMIQTGDTVYRIDSVEQRPDLLPETVPQTIEIGSAEELLAAAARINEGKFENRFDTYLLTADIDLSGVEWTPIGLNNRVLEYWYDYDTERDPNLKGFNGTFDGQGHTIKNLTITEEQGKELLAQNEQNFPDRKLSGAGLFYHIGNYGTVKNLKLENASVLLPVGFGTDGSRAGLLAAECNGWVTDVSVEGTVQAGGAVGGMFGELRGLDSAVGIAENCAANVQVRGYAGVGGLAGLIHYGEMINCQTKGAVTAAPVDSQTEFPSCIGGMIGHSVGGKLSGCHAAAYVLTEVPSRCVGGFGGLMESGSVVNCSVDSLKAGNWEVIDDFHRLDGQPQVFLK